MQENLVIIVAGPTASGKSGLALDIAKSLDGAVINADSMQVYQDTPILSAVPGEAERAVAPHYLYEIYEASHHGNVVEWLDLAAAKIEELWHEGKVPVVVGGTGLYIDNLINGTTPIPETSDKWKVTRDKVSLSEMHEALKGFDKESYERLSEFDATRVRRAYEVYQETGIPLSEWHKKPMIKRLSEARFVVVKIMPSVQELDERIYQRFDQMMESGVLEEVKALRDKSLDLNLPACKALGVPELMDYLDGKTTLEEAVELAKLHSRQYAKRQRTWFKNKLKADIELNHCYFQDNSDDKKAWEKMLKIVIGDCVNGIKDIKDK